MFVITGKNKNAGVCGNDSGDLNSYFELGWEIMVTRIKALKMLKRGEITAQDTIVTFPDRRFLYSAIFENVITFQEYLEQAAEARNRRSALNTVDLVGKAHSIIGNRLTYQGLIPDHLDLITKIDYADLSKFDISNKFICLLIRRRDWCSERNGDESYYVSLLKQLSEAGIPVFLGGLGTEKYAVYDNVKYATLQEWATLMHHPNCMALIGSTSGSSTLLGQVCCTSKILVNDPSGISRQPEIFTHPLFAGKMVHFTNVPIKFYRHYPSVNEIMGDIANYTWRP